jgi:flagellar hook assembly protein FlgD
VISFSAPSAINGVKIYTVSGKIVKTLSGTMAWDGTTEEGNKVGMGVYIYKITKDNGDTVIGKLAITK